MIFTNILKTNTFWKKNFSTKTWSSMKIQYNKLRKKKVTNNLELNLFSYRFRREKRTISLNKIIKTIAN